VTPVILHQNMQRFSASPERTTRFNRGFFAIGQTISARSKTLWPRGPAVVGFTEIASSSPETRQELTKIFAGLQVSYHDSVRCGRTALMPDECLAIGVDTTRFTVRESGVVEIRTETVDYRNVVYVVVQAIQSRTHFVVGFLHNMYTLETEKAVTAGKIPNLVAQLQMKAPNSPVYLGGDFNVAPLRRGDLQPLTAIPGEYRYGANAPGGTTWSGSLYDYWYWAPAPASPQPPVPAAFSDTMDGGPTRKGVQGWMSDHCAITLTIG
jgi:hypothetical protein